MAPLVHALKAEPTLTTEVCVTAQHRQMLDQVLELFEIYPEHDLNLMRQGQDLYDVTSAVLLAMKQVLITTKPDVVLVHGDTTTAMAAAMAAFYAGIRVGHVEAGLRTWDLRAPFPEEFNRQVVSRVAHWHFAPTQSSRRNLLAEQVDPEKIYVTGNTVIDSLFWVLERLKRDRARQDTRSAELSASVGFAWQSTPFVLITGHRRENFGDGFLAICEALRQLAKAFPSTHFIYPVHLNPHVRKPVFDLIADIKNIHLIEPLEYEAFIFLLKHCLLVLTDSGGLQEEAPSLGKPVLVMRDVTERPEAVEAGTVRLVGADTAKIVMEVSRLIQDRDEYQRMATSHNPYGDGHACARIVSVLKDI